MVTLISEGHTNFIIFYIKKIGGYKIIECEHLLSFPLPSVFVVGSGC